MDRFNQLTRNYSLLLKWFKNIFYQIDNHYLKDQNESIIKIGHSRFKTEFVAVVIK